MISRYRRWLTYEWDCHSKALASLRALTPEQQTRPEFARAVTWMAHQAGARLFWLYRLGLRSTRPDTLFPEGLSLDEVERQLTEAHEAWSDYLDRLTDADLSRSFQYRGPGGRTFESTVEDILTQLFGHAWYHRGQVAAAVRALGGEPAATDFVFWSRKELKQ